MKRTASCAIAALTCLLPARAEDGASHAYFIGIDVAENGGASISGRWSQPPLATAAAALEFLLTPLAVAPEFSLRCGRRRLQADFIARPEGGDVRWKATFDGVCPAGAQLKTTFRYRFAYDGESAPQLRVTPTEGFAGSGGELWYPQRSYDEREIGTIEMYGGEELTFLASGDEIARKSKNGRARTKYAVRRPAKFAFAYGRYRQSPARGDAPLRVYTLGAESDPDQVAAMIGSAGAVFGAAFGPSPTKALRIVEIDFQSSVLGASEHGMLFVDKSEMAAKRRSPGFWAHELAHQWWGGAVRAKSRAPGASLLTEGLSEYGAMISIAAIDGADGAEYRRRGRDGAGGLELYRRLAARGEDRAIAEVAPGTQEEIMLAHCLATTKGALILNLFAETFGRDRFHETLAAFLKEKDGGKTTWAEVEDFLIRSFGPPARDFLMQWLHRPTGPVIELEWRRENGEISVEAVQRGEHYRLLLPLALRCGKETAMRRIEILSARESFTMPSCDGFAGLSADPDSTIPALSLSSSERR